MLVLGVESSCDETAVSLVRDGHEVLASLIASQIDLHAKFGGVIPEVASREHGKVIRPLFTKLLSEANVKPQDIHAIAVTQGPGLVGSLLVGISFARGLAAALQCPLIPVDHVHAHVHGALLSMAREDKAYPEKFPLMALVVSGGHSNLYLLESPTKFKLLAHTMDDACGECFDKVGKLLRLPFPGGPHIEMAARSGRIDAFEMPRMIERKAALTFSYSGLKTAAATLITAQRAKHGDSLPRNVTADICASFQDAALDQLVRKIEGALNLHPAKGIVIAGGVAANARFRDMLSQRVRPKCFFPQLAYCSDNAAMIAALGQAIALEKKEKMGDKWADDLRYDAQWDVYSRYPFEKMM